MLVTSALRRSRTSNASSSTASVQRGAAGFVAGAAWPGQGLGQSQAEKETSGDTNKMAVILGGCFPSGVTETEWQGSVEEIAEKHLQTLKLWYPLAEGGNKPQWKKLWMNTVPQLGQEGVDAILQKIQAIRKYARKKMKNSTTGARMPPWLKELVACFNCKPALPVEAGLERPKLKRLRSKTSPDKVLTEVLATTKHLKIHLWKLAWLPRCLFNPFRAL